MNSHGLRAIVLICVGVFVCWADEPRELVEARAKYELELAKVSSELSEKYLTYLVSLKNRYEREGKVEEAESVTAEIKRITELRNSSDEIVESPQAASPQERIHSSKGLVLDTSVGELAGIKNGSSRADVEKVFGKPDSTAHDRQFWDYKRFGINFWTSDGKVREIRLNVGCEGRTKEGIELGSTSESVFKTYGEPIDVVETDTLSRKNVDQIYFIRGNSGRIYYGDRKLVIWFYQNQVHQIVAF